MTLCCRTNSHHKKHAINDDGLIRLNGYINIVLLTYYVLEAHSNASYGIITFPMTVIFPTCNKILLEIQKIINNYLRLQQFNPVTFRVEVVFEDIHFLLQFSNS